MHHISIETNRYTRVVEDANKRGRHNWYDVDEGELRAFMMARLWMGMRKQPNIKSYWMEVDDIFYCPTILRLFTRK